MYDLFAIFMTNHDLMCLQRPIVFVSDPTALHTMIIKEEHIFEESQSFILYVSPAWSIWQLLMFCIGEISSYLGQVCWRHWVRDRNRLSLSITS